MIKGVVFDLDGVIVDAVEWHYQALNQALGLFGFQITPAEHQSVYNGLPTAVKLDMLSSRKQLPKSLHEFVNSMKQKYTREIIESTCSENPALSHLLEALKTRGYKIAVASNSIRNTVELVLNKMNISQYFDVVLSNEDVKHSKPNPEIYYKSFKMLELTASECMVIEDSIPGIQAARQATTNVAIVSSPEEVQLDFVQKQIESFEEGAQTSTKNVNETSSLEIIIPMAGLGQRFVKAGYENPKPLIDVKGRPMIEWVVENIKPSHRRSHFTFICNQQHLEKYQLESLLQKIAPDCSIIPVPSVTEGAACTMLLASERMDKRALMIANSDQWVDTDINHFIDRAEKTSADGLIMTFPATEEKWSYAKTDSKGRVIRVAEKNPISEHATVGIYYFRQGKFFATGAKNMIAKDIRTNGEFYVCPVYNELIGKNMNVRLFEINRSDMHGLGTPEDLKKFLAREDVLKEEFVATA